MKLQLTPSTNCRLQRKIEPELLIERGTFRNMSRDGYNEIEVLHMLAGGSELAYCQLWQQHHHKVYCNALRFLKSKDDANEATQDVFLAIWISRKHLIKLQPGDFDRYLTTVQKRVQVRILVKTAKRVTADSEYLRSTQAFENSIDFELRDSDIQKAYQLALDGLPPQQRRVHLMAREEGIGHKKIASDLQISTNTVKFHLKESVKTLRHMLKPFASVIIIAWLVHS
jgi:RNA polymerase sigma-70 factor (ECF subfamily)